MNRRFSFFLPAAAMILVLLSPQQAAEAVRQAMQLCAGSVVPSLFPFLVLSSMVMSSSPPAKASLVSVLADCLGCSSTGARVFLLSLLGGYPVGPRLIGQLVRRGDLSRPEAEHLLLFCNNAGPAFVLGFVGLGLLGSLRAGVLLYLIHALCALLMALIFRPRQSFPHRALPQTSSPAFPHVLVEAITSAGSAMVQVCAFITFFYTALQLLAQRTGLSHPLLLGFVELTCGLTQLSPTRAGFVMAAGLLGWGGLSVHAQAAAALEGTELMQGGLSAFLACYAWFLI